MRRISKIKKMPKNSLKQNVERWVLARSGLHFVEVKVKWYLWGHWLLEIHLFSGLSSFWGPFFWCSSFFYHLQICFIFISEVFEKYQRVWRFWSFDYLVVFAIDLSRFWLYTLRQFFIGLCWGRMYGQWASS